MIFFVRFGRTFLEEVRQIHGTVLCSFFSHVHPVMYKKIYILFIYLVCLQVDSLLLVLVITLPRTSQAFYMRMECFRVSESKSVCVVTVCACLCVCGRSASSASLSSAPKNGSVPLFSRLPHAVVLPLTRSPTSQLFMTAHFPAPWAFWGINEKELCLCDVGCFSLNTIVWWRRHCASDRENC